MGTTRLPDEYLALAVHRGVCTARATASVLASDTPLGAIAPVLPPGVDLTDPLTSFSFIARSLRGENAAYTPLLVDDIHLLASGTAAAIDVIRFGLHRDLRKMRQDFSRATPPSPNPCALPGAAG
ncbi:hypothetical protein [Streptomyces sp. SAS_272]|uniref:hypothetical protein n=1 Tax=Streptomyces sp. SAS_272 TaxID=3412747 RepID=UPI00403C7378